MGPPCVTGVSSVFLSNVFKKARDLAVPLLPSRKARRCVAPVGPAPSDTSGSRPEETSSWSPAGGAATSRVLTLEQAKH